MAVDVIKFIDSADYSIFPSSNSTGSGKVTTESNIQNIIGRLQLKSFKSSATDFELTYDKDAQELTITAGKANINGYWFILDNDAVAPLVLPSDGDYNIKLGLVYDNNDLLAPDEGGKSVCVKLIAEIEASQPASEFLWLGNIAKDGNDYTTTTATSNIHSITLDVIVGPNNSGTLGQYLDTIPDTYVSKVADDTKEGNLVFTQSSPQRSITLDTEYINGDNGMYVTTYTFDGTDHTTTKYTAGAIYSGSTNNSVFEIFAEPLSISNGDWSQKLDFSSAGIKATAVKFELPYTTYFGPTGVANTKNLKVEIGNNNEAPIINAPNTNMQLSTNGGNGTVIVNGNLTVTKDIHANRVYNAVFNGFGEIFRKDKDEEIEYGDIVCVGPDGLIHKFDSLVYDIDSVVGVCSDTIGFMLGGENIPKEEQVEVELVGQIWVKTNMTYIKPGSMLAIASDGTVRVTTYRSERFGIALTNVIDGKVRVLYNGH